MASWMITWFENIMTFNTPWCCVNVDVVVNKSSFSSTPPCCLFLSYPKKTLSPDSFVNSQEWTLSRTVPDIRLGIVGSLSSGKSALVHRYLTGSYMQVSTYIPLAIEFWKLSSCRRRVLKGAGSRRRLWWMAKAICYLSEMRGDLQSYKWLSHL